MLVALRKEGVRQRRRPHHCLRAMAIIVMAKANQDNGTDDGGKG